MGCGLGHSQKETMYADPSLGGKKVAPTHEHPHHVMPNLEHTEEPVGEVKPPPAVPIEGTSFRALLQVTTDVEKLKIPRSSIIIQNRTQLEQDYEMREKIGEGSFGTVFTATHKLSGDTRAIKVVERKGEKFFSEAKLLQEIDLLKELVRNFLTMWNHFVTTNKNHRIIQTSYSYMKRIRTTSIFTL